jgi:hypothetical protein
MTSNSDQQTTLADSFGLSSMDSTTENRLLLEYDLAALAASWCVPVVPKLNVVNVGACRECV